MREGPARLLREYPRWPLAFGFASAGCRPRRPRACTHKKRISGVNRGRLALPLHDREGKVVCYCGRTVKDESPALTFPNGVNPHDYIFNSHRVRASDLYLVRDPLEVLRAENGVENVVAFLTTITPRHLKCWPRLWTSGR